MKSAWLESELKIIDSNLAYNAKGRKELFTQQLLEQGFHDGHTFCLYAHLGRLILPRLKRFRELAKGVIVIDFPLDEMVEAFEIMEKHDYDTWIFGPHKDVEEWEKVRAGLKAFAKYFFALWW